MLCLIETNYKGTQLEVDRVSLHLATNVMEAFQFTSKPVGGHCKARGTFQWGSQKLLWISRFCGSWESVTEKWERIVKLDRNQQPSHVYSEMGMHEHSQVHV